MFCQEFDFAVAVAGAGLDVGGDFETLAFFADVFHGADFDVADDGPTRGGAGVDEFAGQVGGATGLPIGDVRLGDDFAAGDWVCAVFSWREKGNIVAETRGVDDHQVRAGGDFLDPGDAVGGLGMAVELNFDLAGAAGKIAGCAAGEFLHEVADVAFSLEGGCRNIVGGTAGARAAIGDLLGRRDFHVVGEFTKNVGRRGWVLEGREYWSAFAGGQLVELFDVGVVAEGIGPPAGYIIHAVSIHVFEELPTAICGAGELGFFFRFALSYVCFVL